MKTCNAITRTAHGAFSCNLECDHTGSHEVRKQGQLLIAWHDADSLARTANLCGAIYPFPTHSISEDSLACNLHKGHSGDHINYRILDSGRKTFAQWPQVFVNYDDDETDEAMREGFKRLAESGDICPHCGGFRHSRINRCTSSFHASFPSVIEYNRLQRRERRERIATAAMAALIARTHPGEYHIESGARQAVESADALITELDKGDT